VSAHTDRRTTLHAGTHQNRFCNEEERQVTIKLKVALAALVVGVLVLVGCGGDGSDDSGGAAATNQIKKGTTVKLWIMPNGPDPQADMEKALQPFTEKNGTCVVPAWVTSATPPSPAKLRM